MKRNKLLILSSTCLLLLCSCGANEEHGGNNNQSSSDQPSDQPSVPTQCVHEWDSGVIKSKGSCTSDDTMIFTCTKCNETKTESKPSPGHNMTKHDAVQLTENNDGTKEHYTCSHEPGIYYKDANGSQKYNSYDEIVEIAPGERPNVFVGFDFEARETNKVSLMNKYVKQYYDAKTDDEEYELIHFIKGDNTAKLFSIDNPENGTQNLGIKWKDDGSSNYTVYFATNKLFTNYHKINTKRNYLNDGILLPGKTYYYCVYGENSNNALDFGTIQTEDGGVRFVYVPADSTIKISEDNYQVVPDDEYTCGFRDIGGWNSTFGVRTPYGRIYRGAQLHGPLTRGGSFVTEEGQRILSQELGIKTEIDLRGSDSDQTSSYIPGANYVSAAIDQYAKFFDPKEKAHIETILTTLGNENNYPVYFHCAAGADRTGTISFMLNSLMGVNESECIKDYELKTFATSGGIRYRDYHTAQNPSGGLDGSFEADDSIYAVLNKLHTLYPGEKSLPTLMYKVLTEHIGVSSTLIDNFINLNLGLSVNRNAESKTVSFLNCEMEPITVKKGMGLGSLRSPIMSGYIFDHFEYEDGTLFNPIAPVNEDLNLVARWKKIGGNELNAEISTWNLRDIKATHEFLNEKEEDKVEKEDNAWSGKTLLYTRSQVKNDYKVELPRLVYSTSGTISFEIVNHWETHNIYIDDVSLGSLKNEKQTINIKIVNGVVYVDGTKKGSVSYNALFGIEAPLLKINTTKFSKAGFIEVTHIKSGAVDYRARIVEVAEELNKVNAIADVTSNTLESYKEYLTLKDSFTPFEKENFVDLLNNNSKAVLSSLVKTIKFYDWGVNTGTLFLEAGKPLDVSNPSNHGDFQFAYWGDEQGNILNVNGPVTGDMEYYAYYMYESKLTETTKFAQAIYNVTYDSYPEKNAYYGCDELPEAAENSFPRSDYNFRYWSTSATNPNQQLNVLSPLTSDVTLYAVWENKSSGNLEILDNGGINIETKVTYEGIGDFNYVYGKTAEEKTAPVHGSGYEFAYWALNGEKFDFNTPITESITLTPMYYAPSDEITEQSYVVCKANEQVATCKTATTSDARNTEGVSYVISKTDPTHGSAVQYAGRKTGLTYYYTLPKYKFSNNPLVTFEIMNSWRVGSYYLEDGTTIKENVSTSTYFTVSIKNGNMYCGQTLVKEGLDSDILDGTKALVIKFVCAASGSNDETLVFDYKAYNKIVGLSD